MQIDRILRSAAETQAVAAHLATLLGPAAHEPPGVFVAMLGGLGAGKTTFVQGFVAALAGGADLYVTSPTYALAQPYETVPPVTHMDLYRLGSLDDLEMIGYQDLYFGGGITLVEWADRVPEALPAERIDIELKVSDENTRALRLTVSGSRLQTLLRNTKL